jgi:uncharacterized membrane protein
MDNPLPRRAAENPTQYNIDAIAKLEHDALGRRTLTERVSDVITNLWVIWDFLLAQLILISGWSLVNLHVIPGLRAFDPFPFGILALVVSSESVFLTIFRANQSKSNGPPVRAALASGSSSRHAF